MMKLILILGCPSKKVQKNMFGACLMKEPDLVAECINSMVILVKFQLQQKLELDLMTLKSLII